MDLTQSIQTDVSATGDVGNNGPVACDTSVGLLNIVDRIQTRKPMRSSHGQRGIDRLGTVDRRSS